MPQLDFLQIGLDAPNSSEAGAKCLRMAYSTVLPFRVRRSGVTIIDSGEGEQVAFCNTVPIPRALDDAAYLRLLKIKPPGMQFHELLVSEVVVLQKPSPIEEAAAQKIIEAGRQKDFSKCAPAGDMFLALEILNRAIVAYHFVSGETWAGESVQRISIHDWTERLYKETYIICHESYIFSEENYLTIAQGRLGGSPPVRRGPRGSVGQYHDLAELNLQALTANFRRNRQDIWYQFILEAKTRMIEGDAISAVLFVVIALEALNPIVMQICVLRLLSEKESRMEIRAPLAVAFVEKMQRRRLMEDFTTVTKVLMGPDAPSADDVASCKKAIQIRNSIMHPQKDGDGYKIGFHSDDDQLSRAFQDLLKVAYHFVQFVEKNADCRRFYDNAFETAATARARTRAPVSAVGTRSKNDS